MVAGKASAPISSSTDPEHRAVLLSESTKFTSLHVRMQEASVGRTSSARLRTTARGAVRLRHPGHIVHVERKRQAPRLRFAADHSSYRRFAQSLSRPPLTCNMSIVTYTTECVPEGQAAGVAGRRGQDAPFVDGSAD